MLSLIAQSRQRQPSATAINYSNPAPFLVSDIWWHVGVRQLSVQFRSQLCISVHARDYPAHSFGKIRSNSLSNPCPVSFPQSLLLAVSVTKRKFSDNLVWLGIFSLANYNWIATFSSRCMCLKERKQSQRNKVFLTPIMDSLKTLVSWRWPHWARALGMNELVFYTFSGVTSQEKFFRSPSHLSWRPFYQSIIYLYRSWGEPTTLTGMSTD